MLLDYVKACDRNIPCAPYGYHPLLPNYTTHLFTKPTHVYNMQLMTFNSLLMFDIVFVFFLFLVGVTCLVYYLPPPKSTGHSPNCRNTSNGYHHHHYHHGHQHQQLRNKFLNYRTHRECCASNLKIITSDCGDSVELYTPDCSIDVERNLPVHASGSASTTGTGKNRGNGGNNAVPAPAAIPQCCYVKAKPSDVKNIRGPVQDV